MYGNVDSALLWLILLDKYEIMQCHITISQTDSGIIYNKYGELKLELVMSICVDDVFMTGRPKTL